MIPLRVLLVTDAVGGVWVYSLELARALRPLGIESVIAVLGPPPSADQREESAGFRLIDTGLPLEWLDTNPAELRRTGRKLSEIAARAGVDIVQTSSAALLAEAEFDQPVAAVQHSCVASWWEAVKGTALPDEFVWRRDLVKAGLERAAAIVAPTAAFAADTSRIYDPPAPVLAVHNGRRMPAQPELPRGDFVFTAGRLWDEGKNVETLDRAASRLDIPVQAAGPAVGPNGASIRLDHVNAVGELPPARIAGLLAARPIYASLALYEPFGLSVLEAAQSGSALLLSGIPTYRELWKGAATFVEARDDNGLAHAIQHLLDNPAERERKGELARCRAQTYAPERMARGMAEIYHHIIDARKATPAAMAGAA